MALPLDEKAWAGQAKSLAGALVGVTTFEAFRRSLSESGVPKWKSLAGDERWKHVALAVETSGYDDGDFQEFIRDVDILGWAEFLAAVPSTVPPRARAALHEVLDVLREQQEEETKHTNISLQIRMTIERIFDLDTLAQTFGCQLFIEMFWPLPSWENPPKACEDDGDWEPTWTPKFRVRNVVEEMLSTKMFRLLQIDGSPWVVSRQRHLVRLYEQMDLHSFPVDCQHLNICIESTLPTDVVKWTWVTKGNDRESEVTLDATRCLFNDFDLIMDVPLTSHMSITTSDDSRHLSYIHAVVHVRRNLFFYFVNVAVVICLICSFAFCAWGVHPADIEGRHATDFTVILTAVAFKLVLSGMLPSVSYLTRLDVYVLCCLMLVSMVTVVHTVLPHYFFTFFEMSALTALPQEIPGEEDLLNADLLALWIFVVLWVLFNMIFWITVMVLAHREYHSFCTEDLKGQARYIEQNLSTLTKASVNTARLGMSNGVKKPAKEFVYSRSSYQVLPSPQGEPTPVIPQEEPKPLTFLEQPSSRRVVSASAWTA